MMADNSERVQRIKRAENALRDVLDRLYPGGKGRKMAERMLRRYGSPGALVEAGKHQLMWDGMSESDALLISIVPDMIRHIDRMKFGEHPSIATLMEAESFMAMRYIGVNIEQFYMLALDSSGKLIECVHLQSGSEDSAPFYLRHVLAEIVRTNARAIVISHNHPNGTARPSQADIDCTLTLMGALRTIGTPLLDHMIMIDRRALSVRGFGYIAESEWLAQAPGNPSLNRWLRGWSMEESAEAIGKRNKK